MILVNIVKHEGRQVVPRDQTVLLDFAPTIENVKYGEPQESDDEDGTRHHAQIRSDHPQNQEITNEWHD